MHVPGTVLRASRGRGRERAADLVIASASAGPDESVWSQIALNVGSDDLASDALAGDEPLVRPRHDGGVF
ncbi:unnamed protein product [Periconia digitata]|uniref:Uncharacterized protein n=1 Tax=Periconia digitata TaxID=1303443 RepID=A0A9W4UTZ3_9PLEO|nr:unnamed protein product [Periconia digitata]